MRSGESSCGVAIDSAPEKLCDAACTSKPDATRRATSGATAGSASYGRVVEQLADLAVRVSLKPGASCARCAHGSGCGLGLAETAAITIDCAVDGALPEIGDAVTVERSDQGSAWLWVVAAGYGLPTLGLVIGAVLGHKTGAALGLPTEASAVLFEDAAAALGGLAGLAGGVLAWRSLADRMRIGEALRPRARRVRTSS